MSEPLRPLSLGDVLDRTASLYRRNFWLFAGVAAVPMGAMILVFLILGLIGGGLGIAAGLSGTSSRDVLIGVVVILAILVAIPLMLAVTVYSNASLSFTAACVYFDRKPRVKEALKSVTPLFGRYLWLLLLQGFFLGFLPFAVGGAVIGTILGLGSLLGGGTPGAFSIVLAVLAGIAWIVAFVYLVTMYMMAFPVCVVEGLSAWESFKRAGQLSQGSRGRIFIMFLLVSVLAGMIGMVVSLPVLIVIGIASATMPAGAEQGAVLVLAQILNFLVRFTVDTLLAPVFSIALVIFYYDQRVRKEGFDILWMMQQAGLNPPPAEAAPAPAEEMPATTVETQHSLPGATEFSIPAVAADSVGEA